MHAGVAAVQAWPLGHKATQPRRRLVTGRHSSHGARRGRPRAKGGPRTTSHQRRRRPRRHQRAGGGRIGGQQRRVGVQRRHRRGRSHGHALRETGGEGHGDSGETLRCCCTVAGRPGGAAIVGRRAVERRHATRRDGPTGAGRADGTEDAAVAARLACRHGWRASHCERQVGVGGAGGHQAGTAGVRATTSTNTASSSSTTSTTRPRRGRQRRTSPAGLVAWGCDARHGDSGGGARADITWRRLAVRSRGGAASSRGGGERARRSAARRHTRDTHAWLSRSRSSRSSSAGRGGCATGLHSLAAALGLRPVCSCCCRSRWGGSVLTTSATRGLVGSLATRCGCGCR